MLWIIKLAAQKLEMNYWVKPRMLLAMKGDSWFFINYFWIIIKMAYIK